MSLAILFAVALAAPAAQAGAGLALRGGARDAAAIAFAAIGAIAAFAAIGAYSTGERSVLVLAAPLADLTLAFRAEPLGLTMLALTAGLNALASLYAASYRHARREPVSVRMAAFSGLALACAGAAMTAANLFAFFVAYVGLALAAFPVVAEAAPKAARMQLAWMLGPAVVCFLPAAVWTSTLAPGAAFTVGGILPPDVEPWIIDALIVLFAIGLAGAGTMPAHRWQIEAAEAPTPVALILQVLAIAPIGAIGFLKIAVGVFGAPALAQAGAGKLVLAAALACVAIAPLIALGRPTLSERLVYSTLAANAFAVAAAALGAQTAVLGAALQLIAHGLGKTALLMSAGSIETATGRRDVAAIGGVGQRMPWTFAALSIGAFSLAGLAPAAGAWPLVWTVAGAGSVAAWAAVIIFAGSAFATFALLAPAALRGFAQPAEVNPFSRPDGAPLGLIAPTAFAAVATLGLVAFIDPIARFVITGLIP